MAGASFAKDIRKVQGMEVFAKSGYWQGLAVQLLDPEKLAEFGEDIEDRASRCMAGWLLERQGNLPEVLAGWQETGEIEGHGSSWPQTRRHWTNRRQERPMPVWFGAQGTTLSSGGPAALNNAASGSIRDAASESPHSSVHVLFCSDSLRLEICLPSGR
jgi:hypothetical protein